MRERPDQPKAGVEEHAVLQSLIMLKPMNLQGSRETAGQQAPAGSITYVKNDHGERM
jgi:hypothetical protein